MTIQSNPTSPTPDNPVRVGEFTFDGQYVTGPKDFMESESWRHLREQIAHGQNAVLNYAISSGQSPSVEVALLVTIQTHYAGWRGTRDFLRTVGGAN